METQVRLCAGNLPDQFDPSREEHFKLAGLGQACTQKVANWLEGGRPGKVRSIGKLRSMVREMLAEELKEIDRWVEPLLQANKRREVR